MFQVFSRYSKAFVVLSLPLQLLLVQVISTKPLWVESIYSNHFYPYISRFLRRIFGGIAVPVGQLLFYSIVAALLFWLIRHVSNLIRKRISLKVFARRMGFSIISFLAGFYFLFNVMWGLNYYRQPVHQLVGIKERPVSAAELEELCQKLVALSNQSRRQITADEQQPLVLGLSPKQLISRAAQGFEKVARYHPEFSYTQLAIKQVYVPELMSFFGVSGIYFPFTGEANINMDPPAFLLPEVICHEMAHQIGFASEDEANFVAYLVCRRNPEPAFQYSANFTAMKYAMNRLELVNPLAYSKIQEKYSPGLKLDLEQNRLYWASFQNPIEAFSDGLYDLFLKVNNQDEGIKSYSRVVELLMGEYRKNGLHYEIYKSSGSTKVQMQGKAPSQATR